MHDLLKVAVQDFTKTLGINDFDFDMNDVVDFSFEGGDRFSIKSIDNSALFYLSREIGDHYVDTLSKKALVLCHYEKSRKFDTQCVLKDSNQLIFLVTASPKDLNGPKIENILQYLMKLHDSLSP